MTGYELDERRKAGNELDEIGRREIVHEFIWRKRDKP
jgi:hypothetical protein